MSDAPATTAREVVEAYLKRALDPVAHDLAALYGDTVVIEMPFAPPGVPRRYEATREEMRARFAAGAGARVYEKMDPLVIHETRDPEVVIAEYDLHGTVVATGRPFVLSYLNVITVRGGLVVHSRDHFDPLAAARLVGNLPQLLASLDEDAPPA